MKLLLHLAKVLSAKSNAAKLTKRYLIYEMLDGTKCYIDVVDIVGVVMSHVTL